MESAHYHKIGTEDAWHWWYVGRRRILLKILARFAPVRDKAVFEVGAGSGTTLATLAGLGAKVSGLEPSAEAREYAHSKGLALLEGDITKIPLPDSSLDTVLALDVLEHVADDQRAIGECARVLRPGGILIIFVPAFMFLWGKTDMDSHHLRRYTKRELIAKVKGQNLSVRFAGYFNFLLFLPILLGRKIIPIILPRLASENETFSPVINAILCHIFSFEARFVPPVSLPFGVSLAIVCEKI